MMDLKRRRFTRTDYYRMAEVGILHEDSRVELIEGEILQMSPTSPPHSSVIMRLNHLFQRRFLDQAIVSVHNPLVLSEYTEPEPDVKLLRPRTNFYSEAHPTAQDALLVVEVIDSSGEFEEQIKVPLYARSGIVELWLVYVWLGQVAVYLDPSCAGYRTTRVARRGETISPAAFPDLVLKIDDILG